MWCTDDSGNLIDVETKIGLKEAKRIARYASANQLDVRCMDSVDLQLVNGGSLNATVSESAFPHKALQEFNIQTQSLPQPCVEYGTTRYLLPPLMYGVDLHR